MGVTGGLIARFIISAVLIVVFAGAVAVLVRPLWLGAASYLLGALSYPFIAGFSRVSFAAAVIIFIVFCAYLLGVSGQLKNQVNFSIHPLADKKFLLCSVLAAAVAFSFALGYSKDSVVRAYILPTELKAPISQYIEAQAKTLIDKQPGTAAQKAAALKSARGKIKEQIDSFEKWLKPFQSKIAIALGVGLFFVLEMPFLLLGFASLMFLKLLFFILKKTNFISVEVVKFEAHRLSL